MYHTVYKITNTINGKIYIGVHKTTNLEDGYMGSGKHLKHAQEKYGMINFEKEILEVFDNPEDMFQMESILVNEEFVQSTETYNLKVGGEGGFDYIHNNKFDSLGGINRSNDMKNLSEEELAIIYLKVSKTLIEHFKNNGSHRKGKHHSEETRSLIGEKNSISQLGERNSQFGTMWIYNLDLNKNKKIKKDEFPEYEGLGWLKGRKKF